MTTEAEGQEAAGFDSVFADETPPKDEPAPAPKEEPTTETPKEEPAAAASDPWDGVHPKVRETLEAITGQVSSVRNDLKATTGRVGALQSALDTARVAAEKRGGDAPTNQEVQAAMASPEAWKAFEEDFTDFAASLKPAIAAELGALRKEMAKPVDVEALRTQVRGDVIEEAKNEAWRVREIARLDAAHPDWEETRETEEFKTWRQQQPAEVQQLIASPLAKDAIKVFSAYKARTEKPKPKQQERLAAAVTPKGTPATPTRNNLSDREAEEKGFNSVFT